MISIEQFLHSANKFYAEVKHHKNHRYLSWEHCYQCFAQARKDRKNGKLNEKYIDYLSLQLAFYLASWGMYRGSSFLLQKDYKVHTEAVKEILKLEYDVLFGLNCVELKRVEVQNCLETLAEQLDKIYKKIRESVLAKEAENNISTILLTKILLGTLGCTPAYDRFFVDAIKNTKVSTGNYNINSLLKLVSFYEKHYDSLERVRKEMKIGELEYPPMKLLDMGFWQIGFENSQTEKAKTS